MKSPILVLDVHYLCHRAFHAQGGLHWQGKNTGLLFGFLKSISVLKDEFKTDKVAFCFEGGNLNRKKLYPDYKGKRNTRKMPEVEKIAYAGLSVDINTLRLQYLPQIGFKNIFHSPGIESDDLMAAMAYAAPSDQEIILVTSDPDLFQCLRPNVSVYSPQKQCLTTEADFFRQYSIPPRRWALVKCIAGCKTDNVRGVEGVGEITALKFVRGELDPSSAAYQKIKSKVGKWIVRRNRPLIELPYDGCPIPRMQEDTISLEGWQNVCHKLGMRSIAGQPPVFSRKLLMQ